MPSFRMLNYLHLNTFMMDKEQIEDALPISVLFFHYHIQASRYKDLYFCPLHEDTKPSLVANDRRGIATCLSQRCFDGDDIFNVIKKMEHCNYAEALEKARQIIGANITEPNNISLVKRKGTLTNADTIPNIHPLQTRHRKWLQKHFGAEWEWLVKRYQIAAYYPHIAIPITDEAMVFLPLNKYNKITNLNGDRIYHRGKNRVPQVFPNFPDIHRKAQNIFVCEGEMDTLRVEVEFYHKGIINNWVAITNTMGATSVSASLPLFQNFDPTVVERVIICYDHDSAGERANQLVYKKAKDYFTPDTSIQLFRFPAGSPKGYDIRDWLDSRA